jgi:hypothetical protein
VAGESHGTDASVAVHLVHALAAVLARVRGAVVDVRAAVTTWKKKLNHVKVRSNRQIWRASGESVPKRKHKKKYYNRVIAIKLIKQSCKKKKSKVFF